MSTALPILQSLPGGSSGTGISYYSTVSRCTRKAALDKLVSRDADYRPDVGRIFHALCEIYYQTKSADIVVELSDLNLGEAPDEARRLFAEYAKRYSPSDFAEILGTEVLLPSNPQLTPAVEAAVGVSPFTARVDLIVRVDERSAAVLAQKRHIICEPGVYLWDYKTKGQINKYDDILYRQRSAQFIAYQIAYNAEHPDSPCKGMVADIIVGHKKLEDKSFYSILVPAPSKEQTAHFREFLEDAKLRAGVQKPNWTACFDYNKPCQHLTSGLCDRS
jgi:hypothetical protein